jgi:hypothetical protein
MAFCGLGIVALTAVALSACGTSGGGGTSSGGGGSTGSTGPTSTGSTSPNSTSGSPVTSSSGNPTTSSGTASTGSSSSGSTAAGCAKSDAPPGATILAAGDGGLSLIGGVTSYGGAAAPMPATTAAGALTVTESAAATTMAQYVGAVVYFSGNSMGTDCINASTYTGVQFMISGSISAACTLSFSINDSEHAAAMASDPKAGGAAGSYPASVGVVPTATATQVKVPFTGTGAPPLASGNPATAIDPTKIEGIQWQFAIPVGTAMCTSSLTITNISFY